MKVFSIDSIIDKANETLNRFFVPLLFAIASTAMAIMMVHKGTNQGDPETYMRLLMAFSLGTILTLALSLMAEQMRFSPMKKIVAFLIATLLVAGYYYWLNRNTMILDAVRFILFAIGLHLLVAFSPFLKRGNINGLWQFNKSLFLRFLLSALYSVVIYSGLALAMLAVQNLFSVDFKPEDYLYLWLVIAGIFNTWFFFSGIPEDLDELEHHSDYPKGLKVFTVNVLIPLLCIYLVILYSYGFKIIVTAKWPYGWVAYMVLAFAVFGILSFLLIFPLRNSSENKWVMFYSKLFNYLLIPLIVLLFVAILKRLTEYGITENRYFVIVLSLWLSFIAIYSILTNGRNIKMIPVSLCLVAFLSSFGPWGAFSVSKNSQMNQLRTLLDQNKILVNGTVDSLAKPTVSDEDGSRIRSIVSYMNTVHGYKSLQPLFKDNLSKELGDERKARGKNETAILNKILIEHHFEPTMDSSLKLSESRDFRLNEDELFEIRGYDYIHALNSRQVQYFKKNGDLITFSYNEKELRFELKFNNEAPLFLYTQNNFSKLYSNSRNELTRSEMKLEASNDRMELKIEFSNLGLEKRKDLIYIKGAQGLWMFKRKS